MSNPWEGFHIWSSLILLGEDQVPQWISDLEASPNFNNTSLDQHV